MKKVAFFLILAWLLNAGQALAQVPADIFAYVQAPRPGQGNVQIKQSPEIRNMVNLHLLQQRKLNGIKGFRICIYYNSGQEANKGADQERARFIARYEEVNSYKTFEYPFFKVYVGDFRTKSEALNFLQKIQYDYPNAFIRPDMVIAFPE